MDAANAQVIPDRKTLRELMRPFEQKHAGKAYGLFIGDCILFIAASVGTVLLPLPAKIIGSALVWIAIARLFIIGHDACHGSYTASRRQNRWIGKLAFMPSLTPFRWWEVGHNMAHHAFGNLAGKDHVWIPLSVEQYQQLSPAGKAWYRLTRSVFGAGPYYMEMWWRGLSQFKSNHTAKVEIDTLVVCVFAVAWLAALALLAVATGENVWIALVFAYLLPFTAWNYLIGLVIYVHHTHPDVKWYEDQQAWIESKPYITATVHVRFPEWISTILHHIMEHPAHHLSANIPLYHLRVAQRKLEAEFAEQIVAQAFSFSWYRECIRLCKLYDFARQRWLGYAGAGQYSRQQ